MSCYFLISNKTFKYCSNENYLLGIHDSLPLIEINYNNYRHDILEEITIKLNRETCCEKNEFLLKLSTNETVNVILFNHCKSCHPFLSHHWNYDDLYLNRENELLHNYQIQSIDSLSLKAYNRLKKEYPLDNMDFVIEWHKTTKPEIIEKVFLEIQKGYLLYYKELALQKFGKTICDLNQKETEAIKREESSIYLGIGNRISEPPPPPPIQ